MANINKHLQLTEIAFGLHFLAEITLDPQFGDKLYRQITKVAQGLFTTKVVQPGGFPFIFHNKEKTQLTITDSNLLFTSRQEFDADKFRRNCELIAKRLIEVFEVNEDNIKVAGKVHKYILSHPKALEGFKNLLPAFAADPVFFLRLRPTLREQGKNIHLNFQSVAKDRVPVEDQILIECDINNEDQDVGHSFSLIGEVLQFADDYNQKRLPEYLDGKLRLG